MRPAERDCEMRRTGRQDPLGGRAFTLRQALAFCFLLCAVAALPVRAQEEPAGSPPQEQEAPIEGGRARRGGRDAHGELFRLLGLTPEQQSRLREIRRQSEEEGRLLLRRLGQARRALDEAIYAETLNEQAVEERARELAAAQAALLRLRTLNEVRVRQVLTPEQLQIFRELRQQARRQQRKGRRSGEGPPSHEGREGFGPPRRRRP
jgi:Spy/CpxP family protein refolding chaperone